MKFIKQYTQGSSTPNQISTQTEDQLSPILTLGQTILKQRPSHSIQLAQNK